MRNPPHDKELLKYLILQIGKLQNGHPFYLEYYPWNKLPAEHPFAIVLRESSFDRIT